MRRIPRIPLQCKHEVMQFMDTRHVKRCQTRLDNFAVFAIVSSPYIY